MAVTDSRTISVQISYRSRVTNDCRDGINSQKNAYPLGTPNIVFPPVASWQVQGSQKIHRMKKESELAILQFY